MFFHGLDTRHHKVTAVGSALHFEIDSKKVLHAFAGKRADQEVLLTCALTPLYCSCAITTIKHTKPDMLAHCSCASTASIDRGCLCWPHMA